MSSPENNLAAFVTQNAKELMLHADDFYYTPAMKAARARLTPEWQTATQLSAKWSTLSALMLREDALRRENPENGHGIDFYQWKLAEGK